MKFQNVFEMPMFLQPFATMKGARTGPLGCTALPAAMQFRSRKSGRFEDPLPQMLCGPKETTLEGKCDIRARSVAVVVVTGSRRHTF